MTRVRCRLPQTRLAALGVPDRFRDPAEYSSSMDQRTLDLLAGFAHEIRAPLGAIGGYAELLRMGAHGAVPDAQRDLLGRIIRNQQRVLTVLEALMAYSAVLAGDVPMRALRVATVPLVREGVDACAVLAAEHQVQVAIVGDPGVADAFVDPSIFTLMFSTVLMDAVAHGQDGAGVDVGVTSRGPMIEVTVSSSAPPIDEAACAELFTPFPRGSAVRNTNALALPQARALARMCGGDLGAVPGTARRTLRLTVPSADAQ